MIEIRFKTLIPDVVRDWIAEKGYNDILLEAEKRLFSKLSVEKEFKVNGRVIGIEYDENKSIIGDCSIRVEANDETEAKQNFSEVFGNMAKGKSGQKFKILSYNTIKEDN